ncbi:TPA: conjugative transfer relaxase/helicase TraI domain-containing protein [Enterobacter hormaechei]
MKKLLSTVLMLFPLLAGAADPAFEAGASFGKGNASAGTGALKNPDTVTGAIPGYTANPPEKGYYGGVDGGDGGLANKGQAALQGNDAAQSVINSGKTNPTPAIDPNAPFITIGKNAEAGADGVLNGTANQCKEVTVSKTTFENYTCDKDVASVEACSRTATPGGHTSTTTVQKTFTLTAANGDVVFTNNGTSLSFSFKAPASGPVISAHFYWADRDVNAGKISWWGVSQTIVGKAFNWEMPGAPGTPLSQGGSLPAGSYQSTGCVSGKQDVCRKHIREQIADFQSGASGFTLVLVMNAVETTFVPEVNWSSSCGLDMSKARKTTSTCTSPGGNKTIVNNGQSYNVYSDCWQYTDNYVVPSDSTGTCGTLMTNPSCTAAGNTCTESTDGQCTHMSYTYQCQTTHQSGDLTAQLAGIAGANGRDVQVLASSAERAISLAKSDDLRERIISRQHVLSGDFHLKPQSTLIIEGAERLGLKETLILLGEARAQDAQLVFLDSAGRQANGNAMSVLESAGVARSRRTEPAPGLEAEVVSIPNKRDRYEALANRYAELSGGSENVTAVVVGRREQAQLTGLVREALQNAGQLGRDGVEIEARQPVWLDSKTRRMPGSYRSGMVLEDRTDAKERKSYVIDRVHEDTRVLSLIDGDGVLTRMKIGDISADWRLFSRETLSVATGEKLLSVAGDREHSLKAKDRLEVTGISEKGIEVKRGEDTLTLPKDQPLYLSHAYVTAPGGRDNDTGVVLAALNSRDISTQTMNSLAQSGHRAEVFTAEVQDRAEARLQRMKTNASPVQLVRNLSGHQDVSQAVDSLHDSVRTDAGLAVWRAINDQRTVVINELKLATEAQKYHPDLEAIGNEIGAMIKNGELLSVSSGGEPVLVSRSTWEMEKAILRVVEEGKGTQQPLLEQVPEAVLNGLTDGQKKATTLVLGTTDQFIGIQGYAGVGKTTQLKAVISALETLPADVRPVMTGLAPTHQAVKEMSDVGVRAQTIKSFVVEHDQAMAAGGKPDYKGQVFLIDESSMAGNQDTAALFQAIASGGGRAVSMGDIDQFEAVDVGAPFKLMQERSPMDVAIMKQIVRQKDLQLRGAVHDIIDNRIDAALQRIETQPADRVARSASAALPESAIQETETPVSDIVADWKDRTPEARSRTLIIAQLNADRKAINAGIHAALAARGELGEKAIKVPVLDKITHTRHEFNKTEAWEAGMVVKRGDRYQDVVAVDRNGRTVTVRDEEGKIALISPKELITGDVQLFRRSEMEVRSGDLLKFTATDREQGQMANQRYTVESVSEEGNIHLKGENGRVTINPEKVRAQQHIDYGWAVTGYGAQGASSDYVIALEGTKDGRKALASRRAFYISASRVKEHVQIYTDGKEDWVKAVKTPERDIKTAHDALAPETQRKQAKAIWAMGQPVNKTAIGRAWVRHQGMQDASLTAKIIPATRRYPEPALALPVYDNNGRSAGLALVSLVSSPEGRMTQGETRMVMTERARGAVLQRSQSGNTIVASDLTAALDAVRNHPKDGVVWQTGDEPPSAWLLKVSGGTKQDVSPGIVSTLTDEQNVQQLREQMLADQVRNEEAGRSRQPESLLAEVPQEEVIRLKPEDINPRKPEPLNPDADVIARVRGEENTDGQEIKAAAGVRSELEGADKTAGEQSRASRVIADLANSERDMLRAAENTERGRMPEREEQTLTRTIQKER